MRREMLGAGAVLLALEASAVVAFKDVPMWDSPVLIASCCAVPMVR